jgi:hypothetical protein
MIIPELQEKITACEEPFRVRPDNPGQSDNTLTLFYMIRYGQNACT